jgi:hypothetical protein
MPRITLLISVFCHVWIMGCESSTTTTPGKGITISRSNLRADSLQGWLYYSLDGDSVVPASKWNTDEWDIKMAYLKCCGQTRQIDILLNSGSAGVGSTKGARYNSRFENLTMLPNSIVLAEDDTTVGSRIYPVAVIGADAMFVYDISTHTISPSPDKVVLIKTRSGNFVKFQFTSIYQNAVASPDFNTPMGYYHFRYARSANGSW